MNEITYFDATDSVKKGIEGNLQRALTGGILVLEGAIIDEAPVITGKLKGSQVHEVRDREAETSTNVEYAPRIIHGFKGKDVLGRSYHQAPNNYFKRGADNSKKQVSAVMKHYLGKDIKITSYKEKKI